MVQVLVVQPWMSKPTSIRAALERAGMSVAIARVDIEPALYAALTTGRFDLVIYDPETTTLSRGAVEECMRSAGARMPLVVADDLETLGERAYELVRGRSS